MRPRKISLAVKGYDRHIPLLSNRIKAKDLQLLPIEVKSEDRFHERMLRERPWDFSELSLSSYVIAKLKGLPLNAIPVFPRRLFTHSQLYVHSNSNIWSPRDLLGARVGLAGGYAQSLAVWAKGDFQDIWGIGLNQVTWVTADEKTGAEFRVPPHIKVENTAEDLERLLLSKEIQGLASSMVPKAVIQRDAGIRQLFARPHCEEIKYFEAHHFYPIMHVIAAKAELVAKDPWIAKSLFLAFEDSKQLAYRYYHEDPVWSLVAGVSTLFQNQRKVMGDDPWPYGISNNKRYLERFLQYQFVQGLIDHVPEMEELFVETTLDT